MFPCIKYKDKLIAASTELESSHDSMWTINILLTYSLILDFYISSRLDFDLVPAAKNIVQLSTLSNRSINLNAALDDLEITKVTVCSYHASMNADFKLIMFRQRKKYSSVLV